MKTLFCYGSMPLCELYVGVTLMRDRGLRALAYLGTVILMGVGSSLIIAGGLPQRSDYLGSIIDESLTAPVVGALAPDFTRPRLDGIPLTLSKQRGDVVLLNFWGTWCPPCEAEMPLLQILHEDYPDLTLWAMDLGEDVPQIAPWIEARGLTFPILLDTTRRLEYIYALRGQPSTLIIDRDGRIVMIIDGPLHEDVVRPVLDDLFAKENDS
jgi:thiol-disulfide isomerase/thioredoxin